MWRSKCITHPVDGQRAIDIVLNIDLKWTWRGQNCAITIDHKYHNIYIRIGHTRPLFPLMKKKHQQQKETTTTTTTTKYAIQIETEEKSSDWEYRREKTTKTIKSLTETWKNMRINYVQVWIGLCHIIASSHEF